MRGACKGAKQRGGGGGTEESFLEKGKKIFEA